jgi:hypothetical protein
MTVSTQEARVKPLRNRFEPTLEERSAVERLSGFGLPIAQISLLVRGGISTTTLQKHFRSELASGRAKAHAKATQTLYSQAVGGNVACLLFYLKTQCGFREVDRHELTGADGAPLTPAMPSIMMIPVLSLEQWEVEAAKQQAKLTGATERLVRAAHEHESNAGRERATASVQAVIAKASASEPPTANPQQGESLIQRVTDDKLNHNSNLERG